jgi:fucose permease
MNKQGNALLNPQIIPIFMVFMCMGFGDISGPLAGVIKEDMGIKNNFMVQLLPFMGYIMFGMLSIPLSIYQDRKGKKFILILGILIAFLGLLLPTLSLFPVEMKSLQESEIMKYYGLILLSVLMIGLASTTLQISGNPIMRDVSSVGRYSRNLTIGQFFKAIGTMTASLLPLAAVRWFGMEWTLIFPVYSGFILITLIFTWPVKVNEKKIEGNEPATLNSCFKLLKNNYVFLMVSGIFLYVGIEVAMRSHLPIFFKEQFGINIQKKGLLGVLFFDIALLGGRFLGGIILHWIKARLFFKITTFVSLLGLLGIFLSSETMGVGNAAVGFASVLVIGLGFANIFPLIFSITLDSMPDRANELSGLMVTAIVGGAFVPLLMGYLQDFTSILTGFVVPILCIGYIAYISFSNTRTGKVMYSDL